jgi:hypothetical protein
MRVFRSAYMASMVWCRKAASRAVRIPPVRVDGDSIGSLSLDSSSMVWLTTSNEGRSNSARRSNSSGIRLDGRKCVARPCSLRMDYLDFRLRNLEHDGKYAQDLSPTQYVSSQTQIGSELSIHPGQEIGRTHVWGIPNFSFRHCPYRLFRSDSKECISGKTYTASHYQEGYV